MKVKNGLVRGWFNFSEKNLKCFVCLRCWRKIVREKLFYPITKYLKDIENTLNDTVQRIRPKVVVNKNDDNILKIGLHHKT